ncbi:hypothetical protein [Deinococcus hohokamensis]|uniref:Uncharacterized protein n=1 Tax=Deinococcus hohokamensis TaxID=309883 RepID=A0ABV9I4R1_9DEIO
MNPLRSPLAGVGLIVALGSFILMVRPATQLLGSAGFGMVLAMALLILAGSLQTTGSRMAANLVSACGLISLAVCFYRAGQALLWW